MDSSTLKGLYNGRRAKIVSCHPDAILLFCLLQRRISSRASTTIQSSSAPRTDAAAEFQNPIRTGDAGGCGARSRLATAYRGGAESHQPTTPDADPFAGLHIAEASGANPAAEIQIAATPATALAAGFRITETPRGASVIAAARRRSRGCRRASASVCRRCPGDATPQLRGARGGSRIHPALLSSSDIHVQVPESCRQDWNLSTKMSPNLVLIATRASRKVDPVFVRILGPPWILAVRMGRRPLPFAFRRHRSRRPGTAARDGRSDGCVRIADRRCEEGPRARDAHDTRGRLRPRARRARDPR